MKDKRGWEGLPQYSRDMYNERYFLDSETYNEWVTRVASAYSDDTPHRLRLETYLRNYWFHPSTPPSSNAGVPSRGLPISCYTNEVSDSKEGIFSTWEENNWLGATGGGIGTTWSNVREIGAKVGTHGGESSGIIPFIKVSDSTTLAVSQGGLRRASQAVYLDVNHPEIKEFIDVRRPTGDKDRRSTNIHHGVALSDEFMEAVESKGNIDLVSPKTGETIETVPAFDIWKKILISRVETGEPYLFFKDTANHNKPYEYSIHNRRIKTSNLCSEIMLHTDELRTGVCCLVSVNLEYFDEWEKKKLFMEDIHRFTDNVLSSFIQLTKDRKGFEKAHRSALEERSIGIGVMGWHSYLQSKNLPVSSLSTTYLTKKVFSHISTSLEKSNIVLGKEKGTAKISNSKRNVNVTAIAPTASISTLCGLTSAGIDTRVSNIYVAKSNIGSYTIKNKYLEMVLEQRGKNTGTIWKSILKNQGSVQHLDCLTDEEKYVFKTAYEVPQLAVINNTSIMQEHITQGISCNLFIPADINVKLLHQIHLMAWKKKLKSLYYLRSTSLNRANTGNTDRVELEADTCLGCA
ncbi:MAG: ribonucleoside-diphosphate reductase subunit alpha [Helicobacteraceae bacterium]|nr:ribonucleoside-diphosphate reductase subunit alpha [Helicobacteraceae bacterium]